MIEAKRKTIAKQIKALDAHEVTLKSGKFKISAETSR